MAIDSIVWCLPGFVCMVIFSCCLYEKAPESHQMQRTPERFCCRLLQRCGQDAIKSHSSRPDLMALVQPGSRHRAMSVYESRNRWRRLLASPGLYLATFAFPSVHSFPSGNEASIRSSCSTFTGLNAWDGRSRGPSPLHKDATRSRVAFQSDPTGDIFNSLSPSTRQI